MMDRTKLKLYRSLMPGECNSKSREKLTKEIGISDRALRNYIAALRRDGIPVCSNSKNPGYYIANTDEEVTHFINENHKKAMVMLHINKKVKEGFGKTGYYYNLEDLVKSSNSGR
jgi:biotin operon repressor